MGSAHTLNRNIEEVENSHGGLRVGTTGDYIAKSSGTTGGTGSAGAGNQYIEITVNGTTYKVLHDGTV